MIDRSHNYDWTNVEAHAHKWVTSRRFSGNFNGTNGSDSISQYFYSKLLPAKPEVKSDSGAVFNLEFSPDGSFLASATAKRNIFFADATSHRIFARAADAHKDSVNFLRFVGEWQLVSCSDDRTAALWDVRQLSDHQGSRPLHRFQHGHRGWLKNVEYLPNTQTLITAGFDNMVKAWPMPELKYETQNGDSSGSDERSMSELVLRVEPLCRMTITPKPSPMSPIFHQHRQNSNELKMILTTVNGHVIIVHNLNVETLKKEGVNILMKHITANSESNDSSNGPIIVKRRNMPPNSRIDCSNRAGSFIEDGERFHEKQENQIEVLSPSSILPPADQKESNSTETSRKRKIVLDSLSGLCDWSVNSVACHPESLCCAVRMSSHVQSQPELTCVLDLASSPSPSDLVHFTSTRGHQKSIGEIRVRGSEDAIRGLDATGPKQSNYSSQKRLLYCTEETSNGATFIKELDFSPNGRLLVSPFGFGFRLLGFTPSMGEPLDVSQMQFPSPLYELKSVFCHKKPVVVAKFSPTQLSVASACLDGTVVFSHPFARK